MSWCTDSDCRNQLRNTTSLSPDVTSFSTVLMYGETYFFYIQVRTRYGDGEPSEKDVITPTLKAKVSGLSARITDGIRVRVQWIEPGEVHTEEILVCSTTTDRTEKFCSIFSFAFNLMLDLIRIPATFLSCSQKLSVGGVCPLK